MGTVGEDDRTQGGGIYQPAWLHHVKYFIGFLRQGIPVEQENNRMVLLYFALNALDTMGSLDLVRSDERESIVAWVLSRQISSNENGGFRSLGPPRGFDGAMPMGTHDRGHLTMTQCAIAVLALLGEPVRERVCWEGCRGLIKSCQLPCGSFLSSPLSEEADVRFVYSACVCSYMMDDWSAIDTERVTEYLASCQSYDGAFGMTPGMEGHGGATYCAVASLWMLGKLSACNVRALTVWCSARQREGFHGRPCKDDDTCYTYWVGGVMCILGLQDCVDVERLLGFVETCEGSFGFAKEPEADPDPLHTSLLISALGMLGCCPALAAVHPAVGLRKDIVQGLRPQERTIDA